MDGTQNVTGEKTLRDDSLKTGGQILVDCLAAQGVSTVFGVPGESYLAVLDALYEHEEIRFVTCRQEGGAAFAAEAWGKLTGEPGVCFVTRGPGATNASIGVHTAMQNSTPMILFIGQVGTHELGRESFQEIDYKSMFADIAKWVVEIDSAERMTETIARAWVTAQSGRPGPVVVALPEDVLRDQAPGYQLPQLRVPKAGCETGLPSEAAVLLDNSEKPLIIIGGGGWHGGPELPGLTDWCETGAIPIIATFRCQDLIDNYSPCYVGDCGLGMPSHVKEMIAEADVILALNIRFSDNTTDGFTLLEVPIPKQTVIHVHPSPTELGKIYHVRLPIHSNPEEFLRTLIVQPIYPSETRKTRLEELKSKYEQTFELPPQPGNLDLGEVMKHLQATVPPDTVLTNGAGNFAIWPARHFKFGEGHRLLAPQSGAMGAGIPAAVAAKVMDNTRMVVCFAGDGDFQMTFQELGTAMQYDARPIVLVINNGTYGTIRMHQERDYPDRISGTELKNPDFTKIADAYGMYGERVEKTEDFPDAFLRAMMSPTGAILDLIVDPEGSTPRKTLSDIRGTGA